MALLFIIIIVVLFTLSILIGGIVYYLGSTNNVQSVNTQFTNAKQTTSINPRDAGWCDWDDWSPCDEKGISTRNRKCECPLAQDGGKNCNGSSIETIACTVDKGIPGYIFGDLRSRLQIPGIKSDIHELKCTDNAFITDINVSSWPGYMTGLEVKCSNGINPPAWHTGEYEPSVPETITKYNSPTGFKQLAANSSPASINLWKTENQAGKITTVGFTATTDRLLNITAMTDDWIHGSGTATNKCSTNAKINAIYLETPPSSGSVINMGSSCITFSPPYVNKPIPSKVINPSQSNTQVIQNIMPEPIAIGQSLQN